MIRTVVLSVLLVGLAAGQQPPPFGTVVDSWPLDSIGLYSGAGITWRRDEGRLYLVDQGYLAPPRVWSCRPEDPPGTMRAETWDFPNIGDLTTDTPLAVAWDPDSGCFWLGVLQDHSLLKPYYLMRMVRRDSLWVWGGRAADSWKVFDSRDPAFTPWVSGMEKWPGLSSFVGAVIRADMDSSLFKFDPYTKTELAWLLNDPGNWGCGLVPADSFYIVSVARASVSFVKLDSAGSVLQMAGAPQYIVDMTLVVPQFPRPEDTVFFFATTVEDTVRLYKVSAGMLWGQLGTVGTPDRFSVCVDLAPGPTFVRHMLVLPYGLKAELLDISGRKVADLKPCENDIRHIAPGVYFIGEDSRVQGSQGPSVRKVVIQR